MALSVETLVPTPTGWTSIFQLEPGDLVYDYSGSAVKVTHVSDPYRTHGMETGFVTEDKEPTTAHILSASTQALPVIQQRTLQYYLYPRTYKPDTVFEKNTTLPPHWPIYRLGDIPRQDKPPTPRHKGTAMFAPRPVTELAERPRQTTQTQRTYNTATARNWYLPAIPIQGYLPSEDPYLTGLLTNAYLRWQKFIFMSAKDRHAMSAALRARNIPHKLKKTPYYLRAVNRRAYVIELDQTYPNRNFRKNPNLNLLRAPLEDRIDYIRGYMDSTIHIKRLPQSNRFYLFFGWKHRKFADYFKEMVHSVGGLPHLKNYGPTTDDGTVMLIHFPFDPFTFSHKRLRYAHVVHGSRHPLYRRMWKADTFVPKDDILVKDVRIDSPYHIFLATEAMLPVKDDHE